MLTKGEGMDIGSRMGGEVWGKHGKCETRFLRCGIKTMWSGWGRGDKTDQTYRERFQSRRPLSAQPSPLSPLGVIGHL